MSEVKPEVSGETGINTYCVCDNVLYYIVDYSDYIEGIVTVGETFDFERKYI